MSFPSFLVIFFSQCFHRFPDNSILWFLSKSLFRQSMKSSEGRNEKNKTEMITEEKEDREKENMGIHLL